MDPAPSPSPAIAGIQTSTTVIVADPGWRRAVPGAAAMAIRAARAARADNATIVLASDRVVRRLNARDRGRDKATNVLTYPPPALGLPGEIILGLGQVRREAEAARRRAVHHLAHLVVHGALHLAGRDHHHAGAARRMELEEARILRRLRIPNPWKYG
jgi:probable rRNA maturation factor